MKQTPNIDVLISPFGSFCVKTRTIRNKNTTRWTNSITELLSYNIYSRIHTY
ncbi:hypothetical protein GIB67_005347 [Kingdonia uniflora]|uniref:Uncharacterized protein n=1 Tax=Kingdonia uniflora TaxID=39325 RepID=A0A7J7NDM8_9MAGN|nr:hypothetical protein GIB67_005347 [Kingdonia uniflora]